MGWGWAGVRGLGMDAWRGETGGRPRFRSRERAWRWCWLSVLRDMQLAERRGRPMTRANARRLWMRRWWRVLEVEGTRHGE